MDPEITTGTRKRLTALDAAALVDIGWTVASPQPTNPADFNGDSLVNGADLNLWRTSFGQNANANADGDADSDGNDLLAWQRQLGSPSLATPAAIAVPAPASATMLSLGGWALTVGFGRLRDVPKRQRKKEIDFGVARK